MARSEVHNVHVDIHANESFFSLGEEAIYNASAEFAFVFVVVHFEDLFEGSRIDVIAEIGEADVVSLFQKRTLVCKTAS